MKEFFSLNFNVIKLIVLMPLMAIFTLTFILMINTIMLCDFVTGGFNRVNWLAVNYKRQNLLNELNELITKL